jgi:hypothetical protein
MNKIFSNSQLLKFVTLRRIYTNNLSKFSTNILNKTKYQSSMYTNFNKKRFCSIAKLDIEKISLDKLDDKPININNLEEIKNFSPEENIIEFGTETKWEETVLNSDIPVVVDCYTK